MSERTSQCRECTTTFECGPTGRLPVLCPDCRAPKGDAPAKRNGRARAAKNGAASPAILAAIEGLKGEIDTMKHQLAQRMEALEALEALGL